VSKRVKDVVYSWIPDPPDGAHLLPGQWTWHLFEGRRDVWMRCYCGADMYLPAEKFKINGQGVVLTRRGRGFGTHGNGRCFTPGRFVLRGWVEHQLGGA
jgi:hypothetical protein